MQTSHRKNILKQKTHFQCVQNECFIEESERNTMKNLNVYRDEGDILIMRTRLTDDEKTGEFLSLMTLPSKHVIVDRLTEQHQIPNRH